MQDNGDSCFLYILTEPSREPMSNQAPSAVKQEEVTIKFDGRSIGIGSEGDGRALLKNKQKAFGIPRAVLMQKKVSFSVLPAKEILSTKRYATFRGNLAIGSRVFVASQ